jgi:excisionase family DNA binding protein
MPGAPVSKRRRGATASEGARCQSLALSVPSPKTSQSVLPAAKADPRAFSVDEVARRLGVHRLTVRAAIGRGDLRAVRLGRRVLVPCSALETFLAGTTTNAGKR